MFLEHKKHEVKICFLKTKKFSPYPSGGDEVQ